ncbi:PAS domain-containing protein [Methylobacterium sp. B1]|uniref:PAS domain-containing protein n=1 Tax=Methylobacterium sp. B1 TaxID=91459 RepID=UPI00278C77C7|nr:PAS domain-containing protein [Methylobacterium sp. B1]
MRSGMPRMAQTDEDVSEAALVAALEASGGVGFWMWDILRDEARADPVSALLFNISPARSRAGVSLAELLEAVHPDDQPHISQVILDCVRTGGSYTAEYRVCSPEGRLRWLFTRGHFYLDQDGRPSTGRGVIVEISDSKSAGTAFREARWGHDRRRPQPDRRPVSLAARHGLAARRHRPGGADRDAADRDRPAPRGPPAHRARRRPALIGAPFPSRRRPGRRPWRRSRVSPSTPPAG